MYDSMGLGVVQSTKAHVLIGRWALGPEAGCGGSIPGQVIFLGVEFDFFFKN